MTLRAPVWAGALLLAVAAALLLVVEAQTCPGLPAPVPYCGGWYLVGSGNTAHCQCMYSYETRVSVCQFPPTWNQARDPELEACPGPPPPTCGNDLPAGYTWEDGTGACSGRQNGHVCTAACMEGVGTKTTTCACTAGSCSWTTPDGTCTAQTSCDTAPAGGPWAMTDGGGACTGIASGQTCTASCAPGFSGSKTATCTCSNSRCSFGEVADTCEPYPTTCDTAPADGPWTTSSGDTCTGVTDGTACTASCGTGFMGFKTTTCHCSGDTCSFGLLESSCAPIPTACDQLIVSGDAGGPWTKTEDGGACTDVASGNTCTASCANGFYGSKTVTCTCGDNTCSFGEVADTCKPIPTTCDTAPAGGPWTQTKGGGVCTDVASGMSCTASCDTGFYGSKTVTCTCSDNTCSFGAVADTCRPIPTSCNGAPAGGPWTQTEGGGACTGVASGQTCTASCAAGFYGSKTTTCSCSDNTCSFGKVIDTCKLIPTSCDVAPAGGPWSKTDGGGTCTGLTSGKTCTASCTSGFYGAKTVTCTCSGNTCSFGEVVDTCKPIPTTCDTAPAGGPWTKTEGGGACTGITSGKACTAPCATGFYGSKTVTCTCSGNSCTFGTVMDTCKPIATTCDTAPAGGPWTKTEGGSTCTGITSGKACTASCATGFYGSKTVTCTCNNNICSFGEVMDTCKAAPTTCDTAPAGGLWTKTEGGGTCTGIVSGKTCTSSCASGSYGSKTVTCTCSGNSCSFGDVADTCQPIPTTCNTAPAGGPWTKTEGGGACTGVASGKSCSASCGTGYTGSKTVTCTCSGNSCSFGTVTDTCQAPPPPCPSNCYTQPPSVDGIFWPYTCYGTEHVKARCHGRDYAPGWVEANCKCGEWEVTGTCKKVEHPRCDDYCWSMPPNVEGIFWPSKCYGRRSYSTTCQDGYYRDKVSATCECGTWVITGKCKKVEQPTCNKYCYGLPAAVKGVYWPSNCWGSHYFKAYCAAGYTGYVEAKCECGVWKTSGTCSKIHIEVPKYETCYGKPKNKKYGNKWSWKGCHGKHSCKCKCRSGHKGSGYKATCRNGKWHVTGSCSSKTYTRFGGRY